MILSNKKKIKLFNLSENDNSDLVTFYEPNLLQYSLLSRVLIRTFLPIETNSKEINSDLPFEEKLILALKEFAILYESQEENSLAIAITQILYNPENKVDIYEIISECFDLGIEKDNFNRLSNTTLIACLSTLIESFSQSLDSVK